MSLFIECRYILYWQTRQTFPNQTNIEAQYFSLGDFWTQLKMSSVKRPWINMMIVCLFLCLFFQFPRTLLTRQAAETLWRLRAGPWRSTVTQPGPRGESCHDNDNDDNDNDDDQASHHLETGRRGEDQDVRAPVQWGGQLRGGGGAHWR